MKLTPAEKKEEIEKHVLILIKTEPVREIVKIYPHLNSISIGKIVQKDLFEFRQKKAKDEAQKQFNIEQEFFSKAIYQSYYEQNY